MNREESTRRTLIFVMRDFWKEYFWEVIIVVVGLVLMNLIFIAKAFRTTSTVDPAGAGQLGDFVGGYVGTIFTLISIVLLFLTFRAQRRASALQSFESRYFELLKMHRDNVAELEISDRTGRVVFVLLIREFRAILKTVNEIAESTKTVLTQRQRLHIAYYCLFFGVGPNSSRILKASICDFDEIFCSTLEKYLSASSLREAVQEDRRLGYEPFAGHQARLGHYYRHLYQTVRYVDESKVVGINKYNYVKTIRAQLSTHEQALLLINSLSPIGSAWWGMEYIQKYRMVKNLPRFFFDSEVELDVESLFVAYPRYFEWQDADIET